MASDNIKRKIRQLAFDLACEEEAGIRLKSHEARNREHNYLLNKLYKIEKRMS